MGIVSKAEVRLLGRSQGLGILGMLSKVVTEDVVQG